MAKYVCSSSNMGRNVDEVVAIDKKTDSREGSRLDALSTPGLAELGVAVAGLVAEFDLDAHEAVVLGDTVGP